jgi:hypothetical protein
MRRAVCFALALLALPPALARPAMATVTVGSSFFAAYNAHGMGDWNDLLAGARLPANDMKRVRTGFSLGVSPQIRWGDGFGLAAGYERLNPEAVRDGRNRTLRLTANALLLSLETGRRMFRQVRLGAMAGAGYYQLGDEVEFKPGGPDLEGHGVGFHAFGTGNWPLSPSTDARIEAGYRWADIEVESINRRPPQRGFTPIDVNLDYSGLSVRFGLLFHSHVR